MSTLLAHVFSMKSGAAFLHKSYGIAAGMRIDAVKKFFHSE
jgi:hypothetical protein